MLSNASGEFSFYRQLCSSTNSSGASRGGPVRAHSIHHPQKHPRPGQLEGDGTPPSLPPRLHKPGHSVEGQPGDPSDIKSKIHAFEGIDGSPKALRKTESESRTTPGSSTTTGDTEQGYTAKLRQASQSRYVRASPIGPSPMGPRHQKTPSIGGGAGGAGGQSQPTTPSQPSNPLYATTPSEDRKLLETDLDDGPPASSLPPPKPPKVEPHSERIHASQRHTRQSSADLAHIRQGSYSPDPKPAPREQSRAQESSPDLPPRGTTASPRSVAQHVTNPSPLVTSSSVTVTTIPSTNSPTQRTFTTGGVCRRDSSPAPSARMTAKPASPGPHAANDPADKGRTRPTFHRLQAQSSAAAPTDSSTRAAAEITFPPPPSQEASPEQAEAPSGPAPSESQWAERKEDPAAQVLRYLHPSQNSAFTTHTARLVSPDAVEPRKTYVSRSTTFLPIQPAAGEPSKTCASTAKLNTSVHSKRANDSVAGEEVAAVMAAAEAAEEEAARGRHPLIRDISCSPRALPTPGDSPRESDDGSASKSPGASESCSSTPSSGPNENNNKPSALDQSKNKHDNINGIVCENGEDLSEEDSDSESDDDFEPKKIVPSHIREKSQEELLLDTRVESLAHRLAEPELLQVLLKPEHHKETCDYMGQVFHDVIRKSRAKSRGGGSEKSDSLTGGVTLVEMDQALQQQRRSRRDNSSVDKSAGSSIKSVSPTVDHQATAAFAEDDLDAESPLVAESSEKHKKEIIDTLTKRLQLLTVDKEQLDEKLAENEATIAQVTSAVEGSCASRDKNKYVKFIDDIEPITNLVLNLSRRLARTENDLLNVDRSEEEKAQLVAKRDKIRERHVDAVSLKEATDRRRGVVSAILQKSLSARMHRNYEAYVDKKMKLLLERSDLMHEMDVGMEQLQEVQKTCQQTATLVQ